jgi:excisionase family DNA binding protein
MKTSSLEWRNHYPPTLSRLEVGKSPAKRDDWRKAAAGRQNVRPVSEEVSLINRNALFPIEPGYCRAVYSGSVFRNRFILSFKNDWTPMQLTLGQAARASGVSKSYLSKLIRSGKITAERQASGEYRIDPSELDRIAAIRPQKQDDTGVHAQSDTLEKTGWERERELLLLLVAKQDQTIADLRADRDAWRAQAERAQQTPLLTTQEIQPKQKRRWWWKWGERTSVSSEQSLF